MAKPDPKAARQEKMDQEAKRLAESLKRRSPNRRPSSQEVGSVFQASIVASREAEQNRLKSEIQTLESTSADSEVVTYYKEQLEKLEKNAILTLNPNDVSVTSFANRDTEFLLTSSFHELMESLYEHGQGIPITVRKKDGKFELIAGRRRLEACRFLEIDVQAICVEATDKKLLEFQEIENLSRQDITIFERSNSYFKMIDEGYVKNATELGRLFNKSRSEISQILKLQVIPEVVRKKVLTIRKPVTFVINGEDKEVLDISYAPFRQSYNFALALENLNAESLSRIVNAVNNDSIEIFGTDSFSKRMSKCIEIATGDKPVQKTTNKTIKSDGSVAARIVQNSNGLSIKINKGYTTDELREKIEAFLRKEFSEE